MDKETYYYIISPLINSKKENNNFSEKESMIKFKSEHF